MATIASPFTSPSFPISLPSSASSSSSSSSLLSRHMPTDGCAAGDGEAWEHLLCERGLCGKAEAGCPMCACSCNKDEEADSEGAVDAHLSAFDAWPLLVSRKHGPGRVTKIVTFEAVAPSLTPSTSNVAAAAATAAAHTPLMVSADKGRVSRRRQERVLLTEEQLQEFKSKRDVRIEKHIAREQARHPQLPQSRPRRAKTASARREPPWARFVVPTSSPSTPTLSLSRDTKCARGSSPARPHKGSSSSSSNILSLELGQALSCSTSWFGAPESMNACVDRALNQAHVARAGDLAPGETCCVCLMKLVPASDAGGAAAPAPIHESAPISASAPHIYPATTTTSSTTSSTITSSSASLSTSSSALVFDPEDCAVILARCPVRHAFHRGCIREALRATARCPLCLVPYAPMLGTQPVGTMTIQRAPMHLDGEVCDSALVVSYSFPSGTQHARHPSPGAPYYGTCRSAYLPYSDEGRAAATLLMKAWDLRVLFTVGTSMTTQASNSVVWNGIHHKTSTSGGPTYHGYPDPTYISRLREELACFCIE